MTQTIELAREPPLALGRLRIFPAQRELVRDDGEREVLEHRVMQVLIALAKSDGAIVTRNDLMEWCWQGRIVGEDALTRVLSRLRRVSEGIGAGSFDIETITKVGYRLTENGVGDDAVDPVASALPAFGLSRRTVLAGGAALGTAGLAGVGAMLRDRPKPSAPSAETEALMAQAWGAWSQGTEDGNSQAIGLYRLLLEGDPRSADGWGLLAGAYGDRAQIFARPDERAALRQRARAAALRSLELEPGNGYGRGALEYSRPLRGHWLAMERTFRQVIAEQPSKWLVAYSLGLMLTQVGCFSEALKLFEQVHRVAPSVKQYGLEIRSLWGAGRVDEAEYLLDAAKALFATNSQLWFIRFDLFLFGGRPGQAVAMTQSSHDRPGDLSEDQLAQLRQLVAAVDGGNPRDVAAIADREMRAGRQSAPQAARALQNLSAVGRLDEAYALADAYFFSRGFVIPDEPAKAGAQPKAFLDERRTWILFGPHTRAMRGDPRFARLTADLGLERYWKEAGSAPDYKRLEGRSQSA